MNRSPRAHALYTARRIGSFTADVCGLLIALGAAYWLLAAGAQP